jgi:protein-S-isoprenylcysteine O-methyltransferase Ste14
MIQPVTESHSPGIALDLFVIYTSVMKTDTDIPGSMGLAMGILARMLPVIALSILVSVFFPGFFRFEGMYRGVWYSFALWYSACAVVFFTDLVVRHSVALRTKTLAARGVWALSRHPGYAWVIFFVFPAAGIFLDNWSLLLVSIAAVFVVRRFAWIGDKHLEESFGEEYREYRSRVRELLPLPRIGPFTRRRVGKLVRFLIILGVASLAFLALVIRPAILRFGATDAEVASGLPGDERVPRPRIAWTQAVTIDAPPEAVWPWLVQVGYRRAGWYNIDAINRLAGKDYFFEGGCSADRIIPELQGLKEGDSINLAGPVGFEVYSLVKERTLLIGSAGNSSPAKASWIFNLTPSSDSRTRLVVRFRTDFQGGFGVFLANDIVNFLGGAMLQQQAMFTGLSRRAVDLWRTERNRVIDIYDD